MSKFDEVVKRRTPEQNEQVLSHVIRNDPYKGWVSSYVGGGTTVFTKSGYEDVKAYRGIGCEDWTLETWLECKSKIDEIELALAPSID